MSDFETRLTEALTSGAEEAPGVDRLADGARTRARARRRTRTALVAVGAVVALAVPVGIIAVTSGGGGDAEPDRGGFATDGTGEHSYEAGNAPDRWHTIEHEGVLVDVPPRWDRLDTSSCEFQWTRYGPPGSDPCGVDGDGLAFYASATFDPARGPGLDVDLENSSSGYVYAGDWAVWVRSEGPQEAMRILASARSEGQEAPDLSRGFRTVSYDGLAVDVPADWQDGPLTGWCLQESVPGWVETPDTLGADVDCTPPYSGYGVRFNDGTSAGSPFKERGEPQFPEHSWAGIAIVPDENGHPAGYVQVVAPTEGLAHLIGGSLRAQ